MTELPPERRDLVLALLELSPERQRVLAALSVFPWRSDNDIDVARLRDWIAELGTHNEH